jgi:hypothetical protein
MKKILLLIAIGVSSFNVNAQKYDSWRVSSDNILSKDLKTNEHIIAIRKPNETDLKFFGVKSNPRVVYEFPDSLCKYVTSDELYSYYWVKLTRNEFVDHLLAESKTFSAGVFGEVFKLRYIEVLGIYDEHITNRTHKYKYFDLNGREIHNPDSYEGVMICNRKVINNIIDKNHLY